MVRIEVGKDKSAEDIISSMAKDGLVLVEEQDHVDGHFMWFDKRKDEKQEPESDEIEVMIQAKLREMAIEALTKEGRLTAEGLVVTEKAP